MAEYEVARLVTVGLKSAFSRSERQPCERVFFENLNSEVVSAACREIGWLRLDFSAPKEPRSPNWRVMTENEFALLVGRRLKTARAKGNHAKECFVQQENSSRLSSPASPWRFSLPLVDAGEMFHCWSQIKSRQNHQRQG